MLGDAGAMIEWLRITLKRKHVGEGRLRPSMDGSETVTMKLFEAGMKGFDVDVDASAHRALFEAFNGGKSFPVDVVREGAQQREVSASGKCKGGDSC